MVRIIARWNDRSLLLKETGMILALLMPVAAIGWSILYLLCGGGLGGAILIFIIAKMLRR